MIQPDILMIYALPKTETEEVIDGVRVILEAVVLLQLLEGGDTERLKQHPLLSLTALKAGTQNA